MNACGSGGQFLANGVANLLGNFDGFLCHLFLHFNRHSRIADVHCEIAQLDTGGSQGGKRHVNLCAGGHKLGQVVRSFGLHSALNQKSLQILLRCLLTEGIPKVFATGSNEVVYADTSGVSRWRV